MLGRSTMGKASCIFGAALRETFRRNNAFNAAARYTSSVGFQSIHPDRRYGNEASILYVYVVALV
jgi:hypothetical protein